MTRVQDLNTQLEKLNTRLSQIETSFNHVDLNRVQQLKPHVILRVSQTVRIGYPGKQREDRARDERAIEKFFSNVTTSNLLRLKAQSFGNRLFFGDAYTRAQFNRRKFDINQSIEKFFVTKEKINENDLARQKLQKELQDIRRIGYSGFLSSKPSKGQYEKKVSDISNKIASLVNKETQSFILDEELLLSLCEISHKYHDEVRSIDSKISDIEKELRELKKQETHSLKMAKAAAFDDEARQQARGLKSKIIK